MVALDLLTLYIVSLAAVSWIGYAPAHFVTRGQPAELRLALTPILGLAGLIILSSWLNSTVFPMREATAILLGLGGAANVLVALHAFRAARGHGGGTAPPALGNPARTQYPVREDRTGTREWHTAGFLIVLMVAGYAAGIAPLINAGTTAFVGAQWDLEIYLPLTEYLKYYDSASLAQAPANPLLKEVLGPAVQGGSGLGFSYLDALVGTLLGWDSFQTFRPVLQFVFSLVPLSIFAFCRGGLGMQRTASLAVAALGSLHGLNLWVSSMGLAGHALALVFLPVALAGLRWAILEPRGRNVLLAASACAAMLLSFYTGALAVFTPAAAVIAAVSLVKSWTERRQTLVVLTACGGATLFLGAMGHARFLELVPLYARLGPSGGWHVPEFSPLAQGLGLAPYQLVMDRLGADLYWGSPASENLWLLAGILSACAVALCILAVLDRGWDRGMFLSCLVAFAALGAYLRWISPYPYGLFKLLSLTSFLLLAGTVQGWLFLARKGTGLRWTNLAVHRSILQPALYGFWVLFATLGAANTAQSIRYFWTQDPRELPRAVWQLAGLDGVLSQGSSVYFPAQEGEDRSQTAMIAYFLRQHHLVGHLRSHYGELPTSAPDAGFDYVGLTSDAQAWALGLADKDRVWRNEVFAVYRRPDEWLASVDLASGEHAMRVDGGSALTITLSPGEWSVSTPSDRLRGTYPVGAGQQQVDLLLAAFGQPEVSMHSDGGFESRRLPSGFMSFRTPPLEAPASISLTPPDGRAAWLMGLRVSEPGEQSRLRTGEHLILLQPEAQVQDGRVDLRLDHLMEGGRGGFALAAVELYRRASGGGREPKAMAFWRLADMRSPGSGRAAVSLDFERGRCGPDRPGLRSDPWSLTPGTYEVHLAVYYVNEEAVRWPWLEVIMAPNGRAAIRELPKPAYAVIDLALPRDVFGLQEALPEGARAYLPPGPHPDYSFLQVVNLAMPQEVFQGDAQSYTAPGGGTAAAPGVSHALLPLNERPEAFGVPPGERLWENGEAALYRLNGELPVPRTVGNELLVPNASRLIDGNVAHVPLPTLGPGEDETIVGVDVYGERPCGLEHYGYWAARSKDLGGRGTLRLQLDSQGGEVAGPAGRVEMFTESWAASEGRYRAFLFTKRGDHFETAPLFDFELREGQVSSFNPFPLVRLPLSGPR